MNMNSTNTPTLPTVPCFTRDLLIECFEKGDVWGLNRRINAKVKKLPKKAVFPVMRTLEHHHAAFKPSRPMCDVSSP